MAPSAFVTLCLLALASAASAAPNPENVAKIDALMPEICTLSQGQSDLQVASLVAQGIELLRFTPDDAVTGFLDKIRAGQYCADYTKLESLFLDAVAFVGTPGAFKVMEKELASGTTGGRLILYTVALTPLSPIFEEYKNIATNKGTELIQMIQELIKNKDINIDNIVKELKDLIPLIQSIIKEKNINIDTVVLELNKAIQLIKDAIKDKDIHIASIITELQKFIKISQDTLKSKGIDTDIMIIRLKSLIELVLNTIKESDINIENISVELQKVIQLVKDTIKDKEFNIDTIVQELNRLVQLVLNTIKEKNINIDTIVVEANKLFQLFINTIKEKNINIDTIVVELKKLIPLVQATFKENGIDIDTITGELNLLIKQVMDFIKENNINYDTLIVELTKLIQPVLDVIKEAIIPVISNALVGARDFSVDTARIGQINIDLLIPTVPGFPLKIKLTGTVVVGMNIATNQKTGFDLKVIPSLNGHFEAQLGFGEELSTGIKLKHSVFTTNGFSFSILPKGNNEIELLYELPEKMELFGIQNEVIVMKSGKEINEVQLLPGLVQDYSIVSNKCGGVIEPITGLTLCYDINTPNPLLGKPMKFRVYLQKSDPTMNGYRLAAKLINKPEKKLLKFAVGTYGSDASKKSTLELSYTNGDDTQSIALGIQSSVIKSTTELIFISQPEYYSLQIYGSNKFLKFAPVEEKLRIDFKPLSVSNGKTYQVETYFGLSKSLNENHKLFKTVLSILENGDMNTVNFIAKSIFFPATFEVEVDMPKNAGLLVYKVEKITVKSTVSSVVVEGSIAKKSPGVFQTNLILLNAGSTLVKIDSVYTISIDSPLIGGTANKVNLMSSINGKVLNAEFGYESKFNYENGVIVRSQSVRYFGSDVLAVTTQLDFVNGAIILANAIRYFDAEVIAVNSQLKYATEALAVSSNIKYYGSELFLAKSKLSYVNGVIELSDEASYLGTTVFAATVQQTLDVKNLKFNAKIDVPIVNLGIRSELAYSNLVITSSNVAVYSGSDLININSELGYVNGNIVAKSKTTSDFFSSEPIIASIEQTVQNFPVVFKSEVTFPAVFSVKFQQTFDSSALSTNAQVNIPAVMKPLKIEHKFEINSAFSYSVLTDVSSGDSVLLHIEGPLAYVFSRQLVTENLDLKISGAFEGTFKIMHMISLSLEKIEYIINMSHTSTPILEVNLSLDRSNGKEITSKSIVKLPFVVESEMTATITMSLIHATMNILALPSTPYARRFKGSTDINWVENNVKVDLYWDAEKDTDKKIELTTKYALDTSALKYIIQGDLLVTTFNFGYKLETFLASPLGWFQGASGTELTITMPSGKNAVAKSIFEIQYAESELVLKPVIAFITTNENKYELATSVVMTKLPVFLTFAFTSETTLSTPQLQQVTFATSLVHEDKEGSGKIAFQIILKKSVLSEELSFEYILKSEPLILQSIVRVKKGANTASLSTQFDLTSNIYQITNYLTLPQVELKNEIILNPDGEIRVALYKNNDSIIAIFYSIPSITSHIVGIVMPSREINFGIDFAWNQITFKLSPEANNSPRALEFILRLNKGVGKGQLEALVTAPSLSKEMRLAVELELIQTGGDKFDLVSVDVQYQVSETPKLLMASLEELKNIYQDLVKDGLSPDFNNWYKQVQKVVKQAPKFLNKIKNQLSKLIPKYYELVKSYVLDIYQLYEADVIAMWNTARKELLQYINIAKTEVPVLVNEYIAILKKTETWNAVQVILNKILLDYPVYYDAAIDFYNNVIIPYVTQLSEMVRKVLVIPEFDVPQFITILRENISAIIQKVGPQILNSKFVKLIQERAVELKTLTQEKFNELKALYPTEFSLLEDVYTNVILPTSEDVFAFVNKMLAISDFDYMKYLDIIITDVPALFNALSQRILNTQIVNKLKAAFPVVFVVFEDMYRNVILPTMMDIVALFQKVVALPVDFEKYFAIVKVEGPVIVSQFMQRVLDSQLLKELKTTFPTIVEVSEDFYTKLIVPSIEDISGLAGKIIALPIADLQESVKQCWVLLKAEVPAMLNNFIQRLPETKFVQKLKSLYPTIFDFANDFYTTVIVPTATDFATVMEKLVNIPLSDIKVAVQQYLDILKVEIPTIMGKLLERIPSTQVYQLIKENTTVYLQLLQGKLEELKAQYPDAVSLILDFYNQVAVPAYSDLVAIFGKLVKVSDVYQVRDVLMTEVIVFIQNLQKNLNNTTVIKVVMARLAELLSTLSELLTQLHELLSSLPEYQTLLEIYKQISQITLNDVVTRVRSYIVGELGFSLTVTAEKLTFVFPLFVSVEDMKYSYYFLTVTVPAYVIEQVTRFGAEYGRILYNYYDIIADYINSQAPIYLQFTKEYLENFKVITLRYVEKIQANYPKYLEELQAILLHYFGQLRSTIVTYFELAIGSPYWKFAQQKVQEFVELLVTKYGEFMNLYPKEYEAVMNFLSLYMNICIDYATWAMNTIVEYPPVMRTITYIMSLTPEKIQEILDMFKEFAMSTLSQIEARFNELIAALPKEMPAFFKMHIPAFFISFITSIISYLSQL